MKISGDETSQLARLNNNRIPERKFKVYTALSFFSLALSLPPSLSLREILFLFVQQTWSTKLLYLLSPDDHLNSVVAKNFCVI